MAEGKTFYLRHTEARQRAAAFAMQAPEGWVASFREPTRNLEANAALHAMIGEIAERRVWCGKRWPLEVWKRLLVSAWSRAKGEHVQVVPALDGAGVDVVMIRTSKLSQAEVRDLMGWIEAWDAQEIEA